MYSVSLTICTLSISTTQFVYCNIIRAQFSAENFAKFRRPVCKSLWLTVASVQIPRLTHSKLSSILLKKLHFLEASMVLSSASNIQRKLSIFFSFQKCNLSISRIVFIYIVPYYDGNYQ